MAERLDKKEFKEELEEQVEELVKRFLTSGIIVDEMRARTSPCKCYKGAEGELICFSEGIIGVLSDKEEQTFCPRMEEKKVR